MDHLEARNVDCVFPPATDEEERDKTSITCHAFLDVPTGCNDFDEYSSDRVWGACEGGAEGDVCTGSAAREAMYFSLFVSWKGAESS